MLRRLFLANIVTGVLLARPARAQGQQQTGTEGVFIETPASGEAHKGKVLLAVQAHSDDIPLLSAGTVAKLIEEGYKGYLLRATNDDMGDAPGLGTDGTIGENVLGNERDNAEVARILGCQRTFDLNYGNHRMADVSLNELISRLILIIRAVKVDTVVCWDPWAHDEENPDHYMIARGIEAACWMAGRKHDYPEQFAAGLEPYAVQEKYYYARRPEITRVVDVSRQVDKIVDSNRANVAKGPAGRHGSQLRAELARAGKKLPLLGDDDDTADRNYIKEFVLSRRRELGRKYGLEYAEAFHYIGPRTGSGSTREDYTKRNAVTDPLEFPLSIRQWSRPRSPQLALSNLPKPVLLTQSFTRNSGRAPNQVLSRCCVCQWSMAGQVGLSASSVLRVPPGSRFRDPRTDISIVVQRDHGWPLPNIARSALDRTRCLLHSRPIRSLELMCQALSDTLRPPTHPTHQ